MKDSGQQTKARALAHPHPIETADGILVPIKIISVNAKITHQPKNETDTRLDPRPKGVVEATMVFRPLFDGFPMFDLVPGVLDGSLDNVALGLGEVTLFHYHGTETPIPISTFRVLKRKLLAGQAYTLTLRYNIYLDLDSEYEALLGFNNTKPPFDIMPLPVIDKSPVPSEPPVEFPINLLSFMRDVTYEHDRGFQRRSLLEKWFPSNFEFDQYPLQFSFSTTSPAQLGIFANGDVVETEPGKGFEVSFPDHYNSSCHFFHIYDREKYPYYTATWDYTRADGSGFPVIYYTNVDLTQGGGPANFARAQRTINNQITKMETRVGRYAHPQLVFFQSHILWGGQEYAGATITHLIEANHEISHSWFGRCVLPANGNAGWVDEALATAINKAPTAPGVQENRLAGFDNHWRATNWNAYTAGATFISRVSALDSVLFNSFLKTFYEENKFKVITHDFFVAELKGAMGEAHAVAIDTLLDLYVYLDSKNLRLLNSKEDPQGEC